MPELFTNLRNSARGFVDRNNDGRMSGREWASAAFRGALMGPMGVGFRIGVPAVARTLADSDAGQGFSNWMARHGIGGGPFVGPPEESRSRTSRAPTDAVFSDSGESSERSSRSSGGGGGSHRPRAIPGAASPRQAFSGSTNARNNLITGGYGQGGVLGMGNRALMRQSSETFQGPTGRIQPR